MSGNKLKASSINKSKRLRVAFVLRAWKNWIEWGDQWLEWLISWPHWAIISIILVISADGWCYSWSWIRGCWIVSIPVNWIIAHYWCRESILNILIRLWKILASYNILRVVLEESKSCFTEVYIVIWSICWDDCTFWKSKEWSTSWIKAESSPSTWSKEKSHICANCFWSKNVCAKITLRIAISSNGAIFVGLALPSNLRAWITNSLITWSTVTKWVISTLITSSSIHYRCRGCRSVWSTSKISIWKTINHEWWTGLLKCIKWKWTSISFSTILNKHCRNRVTPMHAGSII